MSKCMTIDESIDQKDTCTEIAPKDIVEFILEEVLLSALIVSDKGCSRIGDFNITEDFCQQYDRLPVVNDFEQTNCTGNPSETNQEWTVNAGKNTDRPISLITAKENLESIIDSLVKTEEKIRHGGECTVITEDVLGDNELQIQNGQSYIERNNSRGSGFPEAAVREYFDRKDVIRDEKIEIQYYNEGKLSKIYVPLISSGRIEVQTPERREEIREEIRGEFEESSIQEVLSEKISIPEETNIREDKSDETHIKKEVKLQEINTEEVKLEEINIKEDKLEEKESEETFQVKEDSCLQLYCTENPEGSTKAFSGEEFRQVLPEGAMDPNRPRACAFGEEDVKKILKEIEEISLSQSHAFSEDSDVAVRPDGHGDADLESRSFIGSNVDKTVDIRTSEQILSKSFIDLNLGERSNIEEYPETVEQEVGFFDEVLGKEQSSEQSFLYDVMQLKTPAKEKQSSTEILSDGNSPFNNGNIRGEQHLQYQVVEEESQLNSRLYSEKGEDDGSDQQIQQIEEDFFKNEICGSKEEFRNEYNAKDPPMWKTSENLADNHTEVLTKNFELTSERDFWKHQESPADILKASRSENDAQNHFSEIKLPSQQSTFSMTILSPSKVSENELKVNSNILTNDSEMPKNCESSFRQPDSCLDLQKNCSKISQNIDNIENLNDRLQSLNTGEKTLGELNKLFSGGEESTEDQQPSEEGVNSTFEKVILSEKDSQKSVKSDTKDIYQVSASSLTPSQSHISNRSLSSSEGAEGSDFRPVNSHNFRLHSPKMYSGINHEPDSQAQQECTLTESEEAFIDEVESVLQVIEPEDQSEDENISKVSFSLLSEITLDDSSCPGENNLKSDFLLQKNYSSEIESTSKKYFSGMTTIGPLKNTDYDPKDLTLPNIDYGKMTRITSSRQLAKEIDLFGSEMSSSAPVNIAEDVSDESLSLNPEDDRPELTSLVNRDIASFTKVQKVREVMSHQPKAEDDFEDEDALPRPRLDLKDVESMTDERYKVPEVAIPLLSLELSDSNGTEKELIENMGLVLSSLTNPVFYEEEFHDDISEMSISRIQESGNIQSSEECSIDVVKSETATNQVECAKSLEKVTLQEKNKKEQNTSKDADTDSQQENISTPSKYGTLGSVIKKASSKFIRKDSDLLLRNSKSLPRDTSKITATENIRSILDDCQTSATTVLKKSKSLLKNTQSIFKSMSSSRVSSGSHDSDSKKVSPSESDVSTLERKLSSFLRKEDFTKAKNLIMSKMEKTFHKLDSGSSSSQGKESEEKKEMVVVVRDEEKLRVDKMENFKKLLPKSPLVYKSQFVKSQISVQSESAEVIQSDSNCNATEERDVCCADNSKISFVENSNDRKERNERLSLDEIDILKQSELEMSIESVSGIKIKSDSELKMKSESEIKISFEDEPRWLTEAEELRSSTTGEGLGAQQPDYIVMETVQGLPTADPDSPSREKDMETTEQLLETASDTKKAEASNSAETCADDVNDIAPCSPELEEEKMMTKTLSERKIKTKKKKLTARFRSFWCSAFGKVKTSPKKGDCS